MRQWILVTVFPQRGEKRARKRVLDDYQSDTPFLEKPEDAFSAPRLRYSRAKKNSDIKLIYHFSFSDRGVDKPIEGSGASSAGFCILEHGYRVGPDVWDVYPPQSLSVGNSVDKNSARVGVACWVEVI